MGSKPSDARCTTKFPLQKYQPSDIVRLIPVTIRWASGLTGARISSMETKNMVIKPMGFSSYEGSYFSIRNLKWRLRVLICRFHGWQLIDFAPNVSKQNPTLIPIQHSNYPLPRNWNLSQSYVIFPKSSSPWGKTERIHRTETFHFQFDKLPTTECLAYPTPIF